MKYIIYTLGCKVNQYETQAMETILAGRGHSPAVEGEKADCVIVNTCAVTAESGRKSRQALRRLVGENPGAVSAVCGCWSQTDAESAQGLADVVWGSGDRRGFLDAVEKAVSERQKSVSIDVPFARKVIEDLPAGAYEGHARAWLKIEDGCANFCSYCIIPYARGGVRSLPLGRIAEQAAELAGKGYLEIVLTGIEIASYGRDLEGKPGLADAVEAVAKAAPGVRIRLGSIEPTVITEEWCERMAKLPGLCPHFHLSMQSGSDGVLARMKRKYTTDEFYAVCERLRRHFPHCALTTDLITGFPGETEEDHEILMEFVDDMEFDRLGVFAYSPEEDTPAYSFKDQVPDEVKEDRRAEIMELQQDIAFEKSESMKGSVLEVMIEGKVADENAYVGRTYMDSPGVDGLIFVNTGLSLMSGDFVRVRVTGALEYDLIGEVEDEFTE